LRTAYPAEEVHGINANPLFAAYADSDYTLQYWSPCRDAGEDTICLDPLIVLTGFNGTAPDMGCFEYDTTGPQLTVPPYTGSIPTRNWGRVVIGDSSDYALTVYSTGDDTLVIQGVSTTDSVWTTDYAEADSLIAPGDSLVVTVTYKPLNTSVLDDTLSIASNDGTILVLLHGGGVLLETIKTIIW
jgi:hypothetical protein